MLSMKLLGAQALMAKLKPSTIKKPMESGLKKITLTLERLVKQATVVDTGRLRSSITSSFGKDFGKVGTMVPYAEFVEYGSEKIEARHMEGGMKVFGLGMFGYGLQKLKEKMGNLMKGIGTDIERKFGK